VNAEQKSRMRTGALLGVGAALLTLGAIGSRYGVVRVLYLVAGAMFMLAAVLKMSRDRKGTTDTNAS
jgi:hypothetical protein